LRLFADEEALALSHFIFAKFINAGLLFNDFDFRLLATQFFSEKYNHRDPVQFVCSDLYIHDFKLHH
jgi:hypothetical protein